MSTQTITWTWHKAKVNMPSNRYTRGAKYVRRDPHELAKGEIFFEPNDFWCSPSFDLSKRRSRPLDGETVDEYLTGREHVRIWDTKTGYDFDTNNLYTAGVDFRAYSKVFKMILDRDDIWETIKGYIDTLWKEHKDSLTTEEKNAVAADIKKVSSSSKQDVKNYRRSAILTTDLTKRYDLLSSRISKGKDSTEVFKLVMSSIIMKPISFNERDVDIFARLGEKHTASVIFNMALSDIKVDMMVPMLEYGIDRELAESLA